MPIEFRQLEDELTAALSIEDERQRVNKLLELAPALPNTLLSDALTATSEIRDQSLRGESLVGLAPYLDAQQLEQAFNVAYGMMSSTRGAALGVIGSHMSDERRAELIQSVQNNTTIPRDRLRTWMVLASSLSSDLKQEAFSTALSLSNDVERAEAMTALAPHLPEVWRIKALESIRKISQPLVKVQGLTGLVRALPKRERADALSEALTLARSLPDPIDKAFSLLDLIPLIPADLREDLEDEAHVVANQIPDVKDRISILIELAGIQSPGRRANTLENSLAMVLNIDDEATRGDALIILARTGFPDVQSRILKAAKQIKDPKVKSSVIIQLQSIIEQDTAIPASSAAPESPPSVPPHSEDLPPSPDIPPSGSDATSSASEDPPSSVEAAADIPLEPAVIPTEPIFTEDKPAKAKTTRKKPPKVEPPVVEEPHEPLAEDESVNAKTYLHSDRWTLDDQLNYSIYADAISQFILHQDTRPPLAIGILAPWGQGKTTLMKLIQNKLPTKATQAATSTSGVVAPPLNTSVTFAFLRKWLRDPKYELQVPKLQYPTVWFNAWKYQNSEQLWAGMAYSILSQLVEQIGEQAEREKFWLALQAERVDFNAIRQDIHRMIFERVAPWIGIAMVLAVLGILLVIGGFLAGNVVFGSSGGVIMLAGVLLPAIKWLVASVKVNSKPLEGKFAQYVRQPTYEGKLGFFHEIETDVQRVFKLLIAEGKPAVVFIDDLDRCSPGTVAQVIEAMNLFLSADFPDCYFVVGMDAQVVAASMEVAYENLDRKMQSVTRSYGSLGWYFMDKFIQLQFSIPNLTPDQRGVYLTKLFGQTVAKKEVLSPVELDKIEKQIDAALDSPAIKAEQLTQQADEVAKFRQQQPLIHSRLASKIVKVSAQTMTDDNPALQKHIERYEPFLGVSPRGIKRFTNLYRFYNLSQITRRTQGLPACTQSALARWLVIMLRWPQVVRWIQWEGESKLSAESGAFSKAEAFEEQLLKTKNHATWVAYLTKEDPSHADWMEDKQLYDFLRTTNRASEKLSLAVHTGVW